MAILVGFLVGFGVLVGSGRRGGRRYQFLALVLTYLAIAINYAPDIYTELGKKAQEQSAQSANGNSSAEQTIRIVLVVAITMPITLAAPILNGFDNPISILIAGFALWQAWKINRARSTFLGPFNAASLPPPVRR